VVKVTTALLVGFVVGFGAALIVAFGFPEPVEPHVPRNDPPPTSKPMSHTLEGPDDKDIDLDPMGEKARIK
jgi:hypothetical protein